MYTYGTCGSRKKRHLKNDYRHRARMHSDTQTIAPAVNSTSHPSVFLCGSIWHVNASIVFFSYLSLAATSSVGSNEGWQRTLLGGLLILVLWQGLGSRQDGWSHGSSRDNVSVIPRTQCSTVYLPTGKFKPATVTGEAKQISHGRWATNSANDGEAREAQGHCVITFHLP